VALRRLAVQKARSPSTPWLPLRRSRVRPAGAAVRSGAPDAGCAAWSSCAAGSLDCTERCAWVICGRYGCVARFRGRGWVVRGRW
jgi:hypothetical protein